MSIRSETETIINWTAEDERAVVYSLMPRIWKLCERAGGELLRVGRRDGRIAWKEYAIDIAAIRIRAAKRRKITDEERARRAEHLRGVRKSRVSAAPTNEITSPRDADGETTASPPPPLS